MARIIYLLLPSMISAMIALPGQIPYWAGGASVGSSLGTNQQLSNLGLLGLSGLGGFGLESLSLGGLQGLGALQGLSGLQGLGGLQVIQIPLNGALNTNASPCMPCIICTPQSAPTNCLPVPKPTPFSGQFCCCCTPVAGSALGTFNKK